MTRLKLWNRAMTAAVLVALAVPMSVWGNRSPFTAGPLIPAGADLPEVTSDPTVAPLPPTIAVATTLEVPIETEVAPAATPMPKSQAACQPRHRGLFRRR